MENLMSVFVAAFAGCITGAAVVYAGLWQVYQEVRRVREKMDWLDLDSDCDRRRVTRS
jgi:hypothetical protein